MKSKERILWEIVEDILDNHGDMVDDISIHDIPGYFEDVELFAIYHKQGYRWDISKEPADEEEFSGVEDGFIYGFTETWDGFKNGGIDKAIEFLSEYGKANN